MSEVIDTALESIRSFRFEEARDILTDAVESGSNEAYLYLGHVYALEPEKNPIHDYDKAYSYYIKCFETAGLAEAQISIADMLRYGNVGEINYDRALKNYLEVIRQGYTAEGYLYWIVGIIYMKGGNGVNRDLDAAQEYFSKGIELKHIPCLGAMSSVLMKKGNIIKSIVLRVKAFLTMLKWGVSDRNPVRIRMT